MQAKTTPLLFLQDFALKSNAAVLKTVMSFALLLTMVVSVYAQPYPNGRTDVKTHPVSNQESNVLGDDKLGVTPFNTNSRSARIQYVYSDQDFVDGGSPASSDKISSVEFFINSMGDSLVFSNITIRVGYIPVGSSFFKSTANSAVTTYVPSINFVEVYNAERTISHAGWVKFDFTAPYLSIINPNPTTKFVVEISYTFDEDNYDLVHGSEVYVMCSRTSSVNHMNRGVYLLDGNPIVEGKNLTTTTLGVASVPISQGSRMLRPYTRINYLATPTNTQQAIYKTNVSASCIGETVTTEILNCYADGVSFNWQEYNGAGYVDFIPAKVTNVYSSTQQVNDRNLRCQLSLEGGGFGSTPGNQFIILPGINRFYNGAWSHGNAPLNGESAYFKSNFPINDDVNYCSVIIDNGAVVTVASGKTVTLSQNLNIATGSKMIFLNNSSLIQSDANAVNIGKIDYYRITPPVNRYDFTYYSSPVFGTTLGDVSPETLFDKYFEYDERQSSPWVHRPSTWTMKPGVGYIIRAPQTYAVEGSPTTFPAKFVGVPNNGSISVDINPEGGAFNLIGNPYPSAVDAYKFLSSNNDKVQGAIYLWTHEDGPSQSYTGTGTYNYNDANYVTVTLAGSTVGVHDYKVAAGQSFMMQTKVLSPTPQSLTATWSNAHRIGNHNDVVFYKNATTRLEEHSESRPNSAGRVWLELRGIGGKFQKMLLAYIDGATDSLDDGYDAEHMQASNIGFYLINDNNDFLGIMANGLPFESDKIIPIGYSTTSSGQMTIVKFLEDGFFADYVVYVNDKLTNTLHNLSESSYTFNSAVGTFNSRFVLSFKPKMATVINPEIKPLTVVVYDKADSVQLHSNEELIKNVIVYDMSGKVIAKKQNCNSVEVALSSLTRSNKLILVEIHLENGTIETQKFQF
ncbi:MAG: hypothetical protein ACOH1O_12340 [Flavobacterium sp.]